MPTVSKHGKRNGEGSIYEVKSGAKKGRWVASTPPDLATGKRTTRICNTSDEATRRLVELMARVHNGEAPSLKRQTLGQFAEVWLESVVRPSVKPATYSSYGRTVRLHLSPTLRKMQLTDIQPQHIAHLLQQLRKGRSVGTVNLIHAHITSIFKQAVAWRLITYNPMLALKKMRVIKREVQPFTPDEASRLVEAVNGHKWDALFCLAVILGVRQGELFALQWKDIDLEKGTLSIKGTLSRTRNGVKQEIQEPKSVTSKRKLLLPEILKVKLRAHREAQDALRASGGLPPADGDGMVFLSYSGGFANIANVTRTYQRILEKAKLPRKRFHDMRHTAASVMIMDGVPIKVVSEILGHSTVRMTWEVYGHLYDEQRNEAITLLERRYSA